VTKYCIKKFHNMKSKVRSGQDGDGDSHRHGVLEEQMIIRFPTDIAARLSSELGDDAFENFRVLFTDPRHAKVTIFNESLVAVLVTLPTSVETHRTSDGRHLFKSGDVTDMLIVYRAGSAPAGICDDWVYEHGLTPPMADIVSRRRARQEAVQAQVGLSYSCDDVDHWDVVEMQLASSGPRDRTRVVAEFPKEPIADPVFLEKVLRRNGLSEFRGYSGVDIPDSEVDVDDEEALQIDIPSDIGAAVEEEEEAEFDEEMSPPSAGDEEPPKADEEEEAPKSDQGREEEENENEEEQSEEDEDNARNREIEMLRIQLAENQRLLDRANPYMKGKYQSKNAAILARIDELQHKGGAPADELQRTAGYG
jgi:transcription initiation factor TFIID subunit 7